MPPPKKQTQKPQNNKALIIVLVAQRCASSIKDVPDADSRSEVIDVDRCVERQRIACLVIAIDRTDACRVLVLPDAEVAVNEAVVQPENLLCISHDFDIEFFPEQLTGSAGAA